MAFDMTSFAMGQKSASGGGGEITKQALNVTENGRYIAPSGVAYSPVNVNVPTPVIYTGSYEVESAVNADQTLPTNGKVMGGNMTVKKITVSEVVNASGGYTVTIGQ